MATAAFTLSDFFPQPTTPPYLIHSLHAIQPLPLEANSLLLSGPERTGKTTLIFHLAFSLALRGIPVLLLAHPEALEQQPPSIASGLATDHPAWSLVNIKYISEPTQLLRYCALLHAMPHPPRAVFVHGLHNLLDGPVSLGALDKTKDALLCKILAVMTDAVGHIGQVLGQLCPLVVTDSSFGDGFRSLHIIQRWLPFTLATKALPDGNYKLYVQSAAKGRHLGPLSSTSIDYSLHGGLCVEKINFD